MRQNKDTVQLGLYILSRLGTALRDVTKEGGSAEPPPRMRHALVELARREARERGQRTVSTNC